MAKDPTHHQFAEKSYLQHSRLKIELWTIVGPPLNLSKVNKRTCRFGIGKFDLHTVHEYNNIHINILVTYSIYIKSYAH